MSSNWENFQRKTPTNFPKSFHKTNGVSFLPNPGNFQNLFTRTKDIKPHWIDGVQLNYKQKLSQNFTFYSNWTLSHSFPSGFRAGGSYAYQIKDNVFVGNFEIFFF